MYTLTCLKEWRGEQMVFSSRGQLSLEVTPPLGAPVFAPWGGIKNWPLGSELPRSELEMVELRKANTYGALQRSNFEIHLA
jgi:hypothetical protein